MRLNDWEQRRADIASGEELDRHADRRTRALARKAVAEVLGPDGPGPFPPSFRPLGGSTYPVERESIPVEHTEDGGR